MASDSENDTVDRREKYVESLERKLDEQDVKIRLLTNEIEKYKQVVQPLTNMVNHLRTVGLNDEVLTDRGVERRIKKIAISGEPTACNVKLEDLKIRKVPKLQK